MELDVLKELVLSSLFLLVIVCISIPIVLTRKFNERGYDIFQSERYSSAVSTLNCYAAGIFLGTCLLHLFPEVTESVDQALPSNQKFPFAEFTIAIGFFLLLTIEQIISDFRETNYSLPNITDSYHQERTPILDEATSGSTFGASNAPSDLINHRQNITIRLIAMILALSIHSLFEGVAIGVQRSPQGVLQLTGAILIHKVMISLSLGLTLSQSSFSNAKKAISSFIFAISVPLGVAMGLILTGMESFNNSLAYGTLQGLAAGTFLYVTFLEVLPNEFRSGHLHLPKLLSFILGFSTICLVLLLFPET